MTNVPFSLLASPRIKVAERAGLVVLPMFVRAMSDNARLAGAERYKREVAMSVREFVSLHAEEFGGRRS